MDPGSRVVPVALRCDSLSPSRSASERFPSHDTPDRETSEPVRGRQRPRSPCRQRERDGARNARFMDPGSRVVPVALRCDSPRQGREGPTGDGGEAAERHARRTARARVSGAGGPTRAALVVANSPLADTYFAALKAYLGPLSVLHWINDALMAPASLTSMSRRADRGRRRGRGTTCEEDGTGTGLRFMDPGSRVVPVALRCDSPRQGARSVGRTGRTS
jgi:hypothetical protein